MAEWNEEQKQRSEEITDERDLSLEDETQNAYSYLSAAVEK